MYLRDKMLIHKIISIRSVTNVATILSGTPFGRPLRWPPAEAFLRAMASCFFLGLVCGFAATDSRLYYDRVPLVINSGYAQDSRRAARYALRVSRSNGNPMRLAPQFFLEVPNYNPRIFLIFSLFILIFIDIKHFF